MRRANRERLQAIWKTVEQSPGIKAGRVAWQLRIHRSAVTRVLPALEREGLLMSEDARGGLWPWARREGSRTDLCRSDVAE